MRVYFYIIFTISFFSCQSQVVPPKEEVKNHTDSTIVKFYQENKGDSLPSISSGLVSKGKLEHGKLFPFKGNNYQYFDKASYLASRAFVNSRVLKTTLATYAVLETMLPDRIFGLMECSHPNGGELVPHRTHQNGLSIDFMSPLQKDGKPYHGLDDMGAFHYFMDFTDDGVYDKDSTVSIDFETIVIHILELQKQAKKYGLRIKKVLLKTQLRDELYATTSGEKLRESDIYVVKALTPLINKLHDDHYHIDFEVTD